MSSAEIKHGLSDAEYHAHPAISNSFLTAWKRNALTAIYERANPAGSSEAQIFGTQVHSAVLEPELFAKRYSVLPPLNLRTTADRERKAAIVLAAGGEEFVLSQERAEQIERIRTAIRAHSRADALFRQAKDREVSIFWKDQESGIDCRCRIDAIAGVIIADLKTTQDASSETFQESIFRFGYHRQAAMYRRAARAVGLDIKHSSIVAAEKEQPHGVNVFSLDEAAIEQGDREISDLLKQVSLWQSTGIIPGYSETVISASLPEWAWRKIEFEGANKSE